MREKVFLNAAEVKKPTLILQGDADGEALPTGAKRLLESLAASDKLLTMVPGAQHSLYGAISGLKEEDDPAKKELVFLTIKDWIEAH
jgi:alpha-beta hydrolase superfamily lysophospholipase